MRNSNRQVNRNWGTAKHRHHCGVSSSSSRWSLLRASQEGRAMLAARCAALRFDSTGTAGQNFDCLVIVVGMRMPKFIETHDSNLGHHTLMTYYVMHDMPAGRSLVF